MTNGKFDFKIEGTSPILMHKFNGQEEERRLKELPHKEQAEYHAYRGENGNLALPAEWLRRSVIESFMDKAPKKDKQATKKRVSPRIRVDPILLDLNLKDYDIDVRGIPVGNMGRGGARDICVRPLIRNWTAIGTLISGLDESRAMKKWLEFAGEEVGIGSNRINGYGRFKVTSFT